MGNNWLCNREFEWDNTEYKKNGVIVPLYEEKGEKRK